MYGVATLVKANNITLEILPSSVFVPEFDSVTNIYTVVLRRGRRKLVIPQADRKKNFPTVVAVLDALLEDAILYFKTETYSAWCVECNCDPDDEVAKREYDQVQLYAYGLKNFLGDALYKQAVEAWEKRNAQIQYVPEEN